MPTGGQAVKKSLIPGCWPQDRSARGRRPAPAGRVGAGRL